MPFLYIFESSLEYLVPVLPASFLYSSICTISLSVNGIPDSAILAATFLTAISVLLSDVVHIFSGMIFTSFLNDRFLTAKFYKTTVSAKSTFFTSFYFRKKYCFPVSGKQYAWHWQYDSVYSAECRPILICWSDSGMKKSISGDPELLIIFLLLFADHSIGHYFSTPNVVILYQTVFFV